MSGREGKEAEAAAIVESNDKMAGDEEVGGGERTSLMMNNNNQGDGDIYSARTFIKARSFRIGLIFALVLLIVIIVVIIVVPVALTVVNRSSSTGTRLSLDDIFDSKFQSKYYSGEWSNGQLLVMSSEGGVTLYDPSTNETTVLINPTQLADIQATYGSVSKVKLSPTSSRILLVVNITKVYRHSFLADYLLYDNGEVSEVKKPEGMTEERMQYVEWNPTRDMIVYVLGYNVYLLDVSDASSSPINITSDGSKDHVRHGIPDWAYEEEVLSTNYAVWWSGDGSKLLFASFNDSMVKEFSFPIYGPFERVYTSITDIPYPKVGTANPTVELHVIDVDNPQAPMPLTPPSSIAAVEHYFVYTGWMSNSTPYIVWVDRNQNHSEYCTYPGVQKDCNKIHEVNTRGWIEVIEPPLSSLDGSSIFSLLSRDEDSDSFTHIAQLTEDGSVNFLTSGLWEVTTIVGRTRDHILFVSTKTGPTQRHVYSLSLANPVQPACLTCSQDGWELPQSPNSALPESCDYFDASCDHQLNYCILTCRGPALPYTVLARFNKEEEKFEDIQFLEVNDEQRGAIADLELPTMRKFTVPADDEGPMLNGKMLLPPGFSSKRAYPVLVYVYGGPTSQVVDDRVLLQSLSRVFLSSNLSMIVASIDGRGTGFRGDNFKFTVYRNLGYYETIDQLRAGRYLQSLFYVDGSKLAIYGASYGGYMAGMVGSSGAGVYSTAISQSPVTDWHYYDSIYTERYMNVPSQNEDGYKNSSVLYHASHLAEVDYLLIHGTGDDNVHFQNSAQLVEALTEANVLFDLQIYTDKAHSLSGGNTQRHLYELISKFLKLSFKL